MTNKVYQLFVNALTAACPELPVFVDIGQRAVQSTDNSIYQAMPEVVIYPRNQDDVALVMRLLAEERFRAVKLSPRGGGSGTDGQSLSHGVVLDCSRYMRDIPQVNTDKQTVTVEAGVVLDQLQTVLQSTGHYLPCRISSGSRACIGGMIGTNAAGFGSACHGRLFDWIESVTCVLLGGEVVTFSSQTKADEAEVLKKYKTHLAILLKPHADLIKKTFIDSPRSQCGYALNKVMSAKEQVNLIGLLAGSEGTLATVVSAELHIAKKPLAVTTVALMYSDFQQAIKDTKTRDFPEVTVAEIIDARMFDKLSYQASQHALVQLLAKHQYQALVLLEITAESKQQLEHCVHGIETRAPHGFYKAKDAEDCQILWDLRTAGVGLVSQIADGNRRPIAFMEDTAVPVEHLAAYWHELTRLLDKHQLQYGLYGHLDVGCIHVRPALDMLDKNDQQLMQTLMHDVVKLVSKYHGVYAGEHGLGYRSRLNASFIPTAIETINAKIKALFDPHNQLNPGKVTVPYGFDAELYGLTADLRAKKDALLPSKKRVEAAHTTRCNGNGACFSESHQQVMCPSYQVTGDRVHSPKGRATLYKMWLAQQHNHELTEALYTAMEGCLECQACSQQCPMHVNIPKAKHHFLSEYHEGYGRRWSERWFANLEAYINLCRSKFWYYLFIANPFSHVVGKRLLGLTALPKAPPASYRYLRRCYKLKQYRKTTSIAQKTVFILPDVLTAAFEPELIIDAYQLLHFLGYEPLMLKPMQSGKALYSAGCENAFATIAKRNHDYLSNLPSCPILCVEPSIYYCYSRDYPNDCQIDNLLMFGDWLAMACEKKSIPRRKTSVKSYTVIQHCMQQSDSHNDEPWCQIYQYFGVKLHKESTGCCGMAGSYGYRVENQVNSKRLFEKNWLSVLPDLQKQHQKYFATGFSCRQQIKRQLGVSVKHPLQCLLAELE